MELFSITTVLLGILTALVLFLWRKLTYWRTRGVPYATPILLSEKTRGIGKSLHMGRFQKELYDQFKGKSSAGGLIILTNPTLMIVDLDLVKNILIKDFHNFPNRNGYYNEVDDPLTAHLVNLEDDEWRSLRSKLTPTFTSGKLKMMFPTMVAIADNLNSTLEVEIAKTKTVEIKEILSRFTIDVIGTIAFGLDCNRWLNHFTAHVTQCKIASTAWAIRTRSFIEWAPNRLITWTSWNESLCRETEAWPENFTSRSSQTRFRTFTQRSSATQ